jgi:hypothetical protein
MLRFLFWNVKRSRRADLISSLARQRGVDLLILAENTIPETQLLEMLNSVVSGAFRQTASECSKITIATRLDSDFLRPIAESPRHTVRELQIPGHEAILLAAAHQPSKTYGSEESQTIAAVTLADSIREVERKLGHQRTLLVGDLNMNPFEAGLVSSKGLNSVATRHRALRRERMVDGEKYPFFFNPMWTQYGEGVERPPGTYHYGGSGHVVHYWNMFDQVLLRPALLDRFRTGSLEIIDRIGELSLAKEGWIPDRDVVSDHFRIYFELDD